ncbi:ribosome biogenesis GTPase YqeH [Granulicatella sp. zg-ZJ]|uniref:ribosome biogenesis GTPase YqeH n=1 Tax=unclassified Granulicatella TaxID=2630493 RepID=UPI0013C084A9|nr:MULTISPECIES: ribosome biogenesis GTPase YqeH [unclassified Granulicatella]NEW61809.1 ribosome biogenesis GTPase YqeH [Granulicatella sp. zg-ZJ]NEW65395.1 ribosome biogenesis GTPase YqeH [Granulicatella sp. zg-84]NEW66862.1 ribosome biogenesis GTPase YqeH [Granulicatella sp. zg-84]
MTETLFCIGCGLAIQTENPKEKGYTPKSAYEKGIETGQLYCQRCFKLRHYNQLEKVSVSDDDFLAMLHEIGSRDALIVNVIDIFDVYGSMISGLHRFAGKNDILIVANKVDLLPKSVNLNRVKHWLKEQLHTQGIKPIDIVMASGKKKKEIDALLDVIEHRRQGKDVYVVGVTNVGKSTLINAIISSLGGTQELITTSQFPGTTLDQIRIPFEDGADLIDTPGIIHRHQMAHYLDEKSLKLVSPQKELKPVTFQLNEEQTLFLGGLARFDYLSGEKNAMTFYFAQELLLHRTKLNGATAFYDKHKGGLLSPVPQEDVAFVRSEFFIKKQMDIVISGLGWITMHHKGKVAVYVPKGVDVTIREAII